MSAPLVTPRIRYWAKRVPLNSMPSSALSTDEQGSCEGWGARAAAEIHEPARAPRRRPLLADHIEECDRELALVVRLDLVDGHARIVDIPGLGEGPGLPNKAREVRCGHQSVQDLPAILFANLIDRLDDGNRAVIGVGRIAVRRVSENLRHPGEEVGAGSLQLI